MPPVNIFLVKFYVIVGIIKKDLVLKYIFILLMLILSGCATTQVDSNAPSINTNGVVLEAKVEPTESQKIYFLQHRLLPEWTYESDGRFFDDLARVKLIN